MNALVLENVSKAFGATQAVSDLCASVRPGCIYGLLGPNGAGKTTSIRMIMDIIVPDSGRIEVLGGQSPAKAKDRIGYLPEERGLYRKMKVLQTLKYFAAIKGVPDGQLDRRSWEWLKLLSLESWAHRKVEELSKGMQQKIQFAVACINEPELLILDEPFASMDPINLDLLKSIIVAQRDKGTAVLLSTHMMHEAEQLCDYILLINKGRAVLAGTLAELRGRWKSDSVVAELEGQNDFLESLPLVAGVRRNGTVVEITLREGADPQELLAAMVPRVRIKSFSIKFPTLHEIFVATVGGENAQSA